MKTSLLATAAYIAVATAAPTCSSETLAVWQANGFQAVDSSFRACAKDTNVSVSSLSGNSVQNATQLMVDKFTKSPNCVAVFTTVRAASIAVLPSCIVGTMCGDYVTSGQLGALTYDQFVQALLSTPKCKIPDEPSSAVAKIPTLPPSASVLSSATTLGLGTVAAGTLVLALLF
ncbi:hypothetical protein SDRG_14246 [Saprolegnia diclina VS20]|uniref:Thioredoxin domain-containing protein n=1 Tax=Saprolegnia diclina (strain VS20) TaxID=1156394 RepID=T0Q3K6_SAPDV|nr:hypothetical protein SDRG_14246 [Saprolegnia diclina VS20]EQC27970.1 hypothetical protein SDRG_14246 [Saprolegnia diclina VS20]|eukprot:XP_008618583.1 hypothetical protein SDRG_14246 [Saprolegnia diclina VS20]